MNEEATFVGSSPASEHKISCGNCKGHHNSPQGVRKCFEGKEIGSCPDQYYLPGYTEDGLRMIEECAMDLWYDDRGSTCTNGHFNASMETQYREGWRYADCPEEAANLRSMGIDAVSMRGDSI
jgi:hypothetical protein